MTTTGATTTTGTASSPVIATIAYVNRRRNDKEESLRRWGAVKANRLLFVYSLMYYPMARDIAGQK